MGSADSETISKYLSEILGANDVHSFTDLNLSQTIEKLDWITAKSLKFSRTHQKGIYY